MIIESTPPHKIILQEPEWGKGGRDGGATRNQNVHSPLSFLKKILSTPKPIASDQRIKHP